MKTVLNIKRLMCMVARSSSSRKRHQELPTAFNYGSPFVPSYIQSAAGITYSIYFCWSGISILYAHCFRYHLFQLIIMAHSCHSTYNLLQELHTSFSHGVPFGPCCIQTASGIAYVIYLWCPIRAMLHTNYLPREVNILLVLLSLFYFH